MLRGRREDSGGAWRLRGRALDGGSMTTIAMLRVQMTLFLAIGAAWCGLSACDGDDGGGGPGGGATGATTTDGAGGTNAGAGGSNVSPGEPHWKIQNITGGGPGCPDLIVGDVSYDAGTGTMSIQYKAMELSYPPGRAVKNTNCVAALSLELDAGWQMATAGIAARGSATLTDAAEGRQTTRTSLAGMPPETTATISLSAPHDGSYDKGQTFSAAEQVWSTCGGSAIFSVDASVNLQVPAGSPDAAGIRLNEVEVAIAWRQCQ
jgi:hypothetical protein